MTVLDNGKILMYEFCEILKKRYGNHIELFYTDTDSLLIEVQTEDICKDMAEGEGGDEVCGQKSNQARKLQKVLPGEGEALGKHEHDHR